MIFNVIKRTFDYAPINLREILRYSGAKTADENLNALIGDCIKESETLKAVENALSRLNANPGRSGHDLSEKADLAVYGTRKKVASFFGAV